MADTPETVNEENPLEGKRIFSEKKHKKFFRTISTDSDTPDEELVGKVKVESEVEEDSENELVGVDGQKSTFSPEILIIQCNSHYGTTSHPKILIN